MLFQFFPFIINLRFGHFRESEIMFPDIIDAKIIHFGHSETLCGADGSAQTTKATFSHVNVKGRRVNAFGSAIRSLAYFFRCLDRYDIDTIYRTNFCALITDNAIINFIVKPIPAVIRHRLHLVGILNGSNTIPVLKIIWFADRSYSLGPSRLDEMPKGNSQSC